MHFEMDALLCPAGQSQRIVVCDLGRIDYEPCWSLQKQLQQCLIQAKRQDPPVPLPHILLLVEHPPVYTLGRNGNAGNLLASGDTLEARGATFVHVDRGGDITYHGPGQLVGYPILDLDRFFTDIHRYLRELEEAVIQTCADFEVSGRRVEGRTGVWIGPDMRGTERKICALGIRCSRWVTMHGFAFNLNTDLSYFDHIVPCGISDRGVTSLSAELQRSIHRQTVVECFLKHLASRFHANIVRLTSQDITVFLDAFRRSESATAPQPISHT